MALDPKKRQKKLEQQKAKRKSKKQEVARVAGAGPVAQVKAAANCPIYECWRGDNLFENGIGHVLVSRKMPGGMIALGSFLLDVYCLGVKDAYCAILGPSDYAKRFAPHNLPYSQLDMEPAAARKLVEGAVAYARSCGLAPHPDYNKAKMIFGDIRAEDCQEEFTYGHDGKPHFMNGPHDTSTRCKQILNTLKNTLGEGNYNYTLIGGPGKMAF